MRRASFPVLFVVFASAVLLAAACSNTDGAAPDAEMPGETEEEAPPPEDIISGVATVQHVELEGGFYGLVADDSTRYNPQNMDSTYHEDGLRVRFRAVKKDVMTTQMWGQPIEILDMMPLNDQ